MNKKTIGMLCGIYSIVAVVIFVLCGFLLNAWDKAWIVFIVSGAACAITSMIGNNMAKKDGQE